jgi:RNA polymerase sigma-70 factor (ECF subfamily)
MSTPDQRRLEDLARTHGQRVLGYLTRRIEVREDAADVWQQVLTTTWRKIYAVPSEDEAALGWLIAVARRELANHRRSANRRHASTERLRNALATLPAVAEDAGNVDRARSALAALSEPDRELITLTYWDRLTSDQAAAALGISGTAARKRLQRARKQLATMLSDAERDQPTDTSAWSVATT